MLLEERKPTQGIMELRLLGWFSLTIGGVSVELAGREQRLAALVALRGTRPRTHLAGTLWPDTTEERALSSLRASVLRLKRLAPGLAEASRWTVGLGRGVRVDAHRLLASVTRADALDDPEVVSLILDGGDVLPGWNDDWLIYERERLHQLRIRALEQIARQALERGDLAIALDASREALAGEPLLESAVSVAIRAHLLSGNRSAAVQTFQRYRRSLAQELRMAPSAELVDLVEPLSPVAEADLSRAPDRPEAVAARVPRPRPRTDPTASRPY
jgi:DNA-binding SARP family transcriptional activator